nr:hypothetical protein DA06_30620 [Georgenia sp. SUBG003]
MPHPCEDVVRDGHRGEGVGPLEDHADLPAHLHRVDAGTVEVLPVHEGLTLDAAPGMTSCMRFSVRRNVDLPQPEGPMSAVTERGSIVMLTPSTARKSP